MNSKKYLLALLIFVFFSGRISAQIYSFEKNTIPSEWNIDKGNIEVTNQKYKLGKQSLKVEWEPGSVISFTKTSDLEAAGKSRNGGINAWIYNECPTNVSLVFSFADKNGQEVCRLPFLLNFKGWRCVWAKFREDMNMDSQAIIHKLNIRMPDTEKKGVIYLDYVHFTTNVSWQKMSDSQYEVNQKDYSLIHNFIGYRNTYPDLSQVVTSSENEKSIQTITERLTQWYLGKNNSENQKLLKIRKRYEKKYIQKGLKEANDIHIAYDKNHVAVGEGLYPMYAPNTIDGEKIRTFMSINKDVLLPLALDYKKNENEESLNKATYIYDWFNDQGWADGSGMGTLCFEKLRSSGYFHSFFLLKDKLTEKQLNRELKTLKWFTMFGACYQTPEHAGEVADNLRALALPKLIYALSLTNAKERHAALSAFTSYMNNSISIAPGYFGTIKADFSGYHHRGAYNSAYYPHALYAASLIAYLLHDTPYALSESSLYNLKQSLLTFRFFSAKLDVPSGTAGRFPDKQTVLQDLLPAFSYVASSFKNVDPELVAAFKRLMNNNQEVIEKFASDVNSSLTYTSSVGEIELMIQLLQNNIKEEKAPVGSLFMPYSGLMVIKNKNHHFNIKGFSKYIWDFEASSNENQYGRYSSYGQIEYRDLQKGFKSFNPNIKSFDWNYIPGTTTKVLPLNSLAFKEQSYRNFSDETFLCGVNVSAQTAMFSFKLHDNTFDKTFRANKSVFVIDNALLCLGSNIENKDNKNKTVTTLFQSPIKVEKNNIEKIDQGYVLSDQSGMIYAVKKVEPSLMETDSFCVAFIDHSQAPANRVYHYYMIPDNDRQTAKLLLSEKSPVQIIQQDNNAHIVQDNRHGITYAAIFNPAQSFDSLPITNVNIPLSYILERKENNNFKLSFCEPDMRRASAPNMGMLSEEEVIQPEKSFSTEITFKGKYDVGSSITPVNVRYVSGYTIIAVSTIRGENYSFHLLKK